MSLNWDISHIEDYKDICWVDKDDDLILNPVTEGIIFSTIGVGIGEIKSDNWKEFAARLKLLQRLDGSYLVNQDGPTDIEPDDVKQHIGLRCNVSYENRSQFYKRIGQKLDRMKRSYSD